MIDLLNLNAGYAMTSDGHWFWEIDSYCCSATRFPSLWECQEDVREWIGDF